MPHLGGEVKTFAKETATNSTTKVTLITPSSGKRVRVIAIKCMSVHTTPITFETYFGTGASMSVDMTKAIFITHIAAGSAADKPSVPSDSMVWPDFAGPIGTVDEVVSMRTSADATSNGTFLITYWEE